VGLCEALADLASEAQPALAYQQTLGFGPIPLTLEASRPDPIQAFSGAFLASSPASWPPLRVSLLSSADLPGERLPPEIRPRGEEVLLARGEGLTALSSGPERILWLFQPDRAAALLWAEDLAALPPWELTSPLRAVARWWAALHGGAMVHAGAVGDGERCVLLVGAGGAGKSTTTMACLGSGLQVLGDDYCMVQAPGAPTRPPIAFGMYRHAKLDEPALALLPSLRQGIIGSGWRGKRLIDLGASQVLPHDVAAVCEVVQDPMEPTRWEPLSRARALRALAPSTLFQQRLWERETWQALTATIRSVPCFRLAVNDPQAVPDQVRLLLARTAP
jgi:hypothetical protein